MKHLPTLLLTLLVSGGLWADTNTKYEGNGSYTTFGKDKKIKNQGRTSETQNEEGWFEGIHIDFNANGSIISQGDYLYKDEYYQYFYTNGVVSREGRADSGIAQGEWTFYNTNGTVRLKTSFLDDKQHGLATSYYENGEVYSYTDFIFGQQNGIYKTYHRDGSICSDNNYSSNKLEGIARRYYSNGKIEWEQNYINGQRHGTGARVDRDGKYLWITEYENGKIDKDKTKAQTAELTAEIEFFAPFCKKNIEPINEPRLNYPRNAWRDKKEGCVSVSYIINEKGATENVRATWSSRKGFKTAARNFYKKFKFEPQVGSAGQPIKVNQSELVMFIIPVNGFIPAGHVPKGCDIYVN